MSCYIRVLALPFACQLLFACSPGSFDLIVRGGRVIDGTGGPSYVADIAIKDGVIFRTRARAESSMLTVWS
jgi:adenine deaminase